MKHLTLLFIISLLLFSCKKKETEIIEPTISSPSNSIAIAEKGSNDETARNEYDASIENAFQALETTNFGSRGADSGVILPCGVIGVDTTGNRHIIRYGSNCGRKVLSGNIIATLQPPATKWKEKGAVITLEYQNYKVLFEVNNQTLIFNGTITVTNVYGGLIYETILMQSVIEHKIRGNIAIDFDNGKTRNWRIFKRRTYTAANGEISNLELKLSADSTRNIAEVGISKSGQEFITTIPLSLRYENCGAGKNFGPFVLVEGTAKIEVGSNALMVEAGQKFMNQTITSSRDCSAEGYKLSWNIGGTTREEFQYY